MKRQVRILCSRHYDSLSQIIYYITGRKYTHVSISLDSDQGVFYSFNGKGFKIEKPHRWRKKDKRIMGDMFHLEIEHDEYVRLMNYINYMLEEKAKYKYNLIGVFMRALNIPHYTKERYFCSQFVAEALIHAGIINQTKPPFYYFPNNIADVLRENRKTKKIACLV